LFTGGIKKIFLLIIKQDIDVTLIDYSIDNVERWQDFFFLDSMVRLMVFNATFNNILAILWSVLLVEETGVP